MSEFTISGKYCDRLYDASHCLISDSGWRSNQIVLNCRVLLAGFMADVATALGIQSLQVGRGRPEWDTTPPAPPDPVATTKLEDAAPFVIPRASLAFQFLDASDAIVAGPTNRLQIVATLGLNQPSPASSPPFPLREFGLFGQLNGLPFMINCVRHPLIEKSGSVSLERRVRLVF